MRLPAECERPIVRGATTIAVEEWRPVATLCGRTAASEGSGELMENSTWFVFVIVAFVLGVLITLGSFSGSTPWRRCARCGSGWARQYCADCGEKRG